MQPTYLPWIGYFDLISQSDTFVFLDSVQFEKQSWQQRNRIKTSHGCKWLTVPVLHKMSQRIDEVAINQTDRWRARHWKSISQNYQKSEHWGAYCDFFEMLYQRDWKHLVELNLHVIDAMCSYLGILVPFVRSSEMDTHGEKVDRLIGICQRLGAHTYLSPPGSAEYIEADNRFGEAGIRLEFHEYVHPVYRQLHGDFVSHLSIVDLLFNEGGRSLEVIEQGRRCAYGGQ